MHRVTSDLSTALIALLIGSVLPLWSQSVDDELPLPRWEKEMPAASPGQEPGSQFNSLLPGEPLNDEFLSLPQSGPRLGDAPPILIPGYSELGPMDLSLFLHGSILQPLSSSTTPRLPTPALALRDLPSELLASLTDSPANEYVLDPQNLVTEISRTDLDRLLEFHAAESKISLYILVLDTDQKLAREANLNPLMHGALMRPHTCLAIYPLGEPWRARVLMSPSLHESVGSTALSELAADCIRDAQQTEQYSLQLQRFAVRLSTRLFWLEKALKKQTLAATGTSLQEISDQEPNRGVSQWRFSNLQIIFLSLSSIAILSLALMLLRQRRPPQISPASSQVWILPDPDVIPRLGGAFSGGAGAMLSFKKA